MDKPVLNELYELNGEGAQTVMDNGSGTVTGNFYKVVWAKTGTITTITIDGQSGTALDGVSATRHLVLTNVTSLEIASGVAIGFTHPSVPAIES
tara:strand:+ start:2051 stop:2332 length:282 start_codon:yes stop_codon:yes gene_type:complete